MILKQATIKYSDNDSDLLKPKSKIRICVSYDECRRVRWIRNDSYRNLCGSCSQTGLKRTYGKGNNTKKQFIEFMENY